MLRRNSVPKMGEQGAEIGGEYEVLSSQESPQKQDMSTIKSEDAIMSDQAPTEVQSQAQPLDDIADLQLITKDDFETPQDRNSIKTLGADSKRLRKTVVKQKTETDNLKVKVVVDNQLRDADRHRQNLELELSQAQAQLAITEQALKASNDRWTHQNKNVKKLHAKLKASNGIISSVKAINSDLQDNLVASRDEFLRCQDDLFSLQPMARVPDSSIFKELEIVSEEVVHWIEAEVAAFEKAHPEAEPEHIFSAGKNADAAIFLQYYPAAGEHLARYLVHRFFQVNLFENTFYLLGLTEEIAQLLQKAEHSMAKFDPPRGTSELHKEVSVAATDDRQVVLVSQHGARRHCRLLLPLRIANRAGKDDYEK